MFKKSLYLNLVMAFIVILQSSLFSYITILDTKPDLSLVVLVFIAIYQGSTTAQITGFCGGLIEDFLSVAPLGFHALIKTLIGYILGLLKGKVDQKSIIFPFLLIPLVTIYKYVMYFLLGLIFDMPVPLNIFISKTFYLEILYNLLVGLIIYFCLKIYNRNSEDTIQYRYEK